MCMLKYPQIGSSSMLGPIAKPDLNPGPNAERAERPLAGQEFRDRIAGVVEAFVRRNPISSLQGDHSRNKSSESPSSMDVLADSERGRSFRTDGASNRAGVSTSRPSSSGEPSDSRSGRILSTSGRFSSSQRLQPGFDSKISTAANGSTIRPGGLDAMRSFEFLSLGTGKRK